MFKHMEKFNARSNHQAITTSNQSFCFLKVQCNQAEHPPSTSLTGWQGVHKLTWEGGTLWSVWVFSETCRALTESLPWSELTWSSPAPECHTPSPWQRSRRPRPGGTQGSVTPSQRSRVNSEDTCILNIQEHYMHQHTVFLHVSGQQVSLVVRALGQ